MEAFCPFLVAHKTVVLLKINVMPIVITPSWTQPKCPLIAERIEKCGTVVCRLTTGIYGLRNASQGDFTVVWTSQSALITKLDGTAYTHLG